MSYVTVPNVRISVADGQVVLSLPESVLATLACESTVTENTELNARRAFRVLVREWMDVRAFLIDGDHRLSVRLNDVSLTGFEIHQPQRNDLRLPMNQDVMLNIETGPHYVELPCRPIRIQDETIAFRFERHNVGPEIEPPFVLEQIVMDLQRQWVTHNGYSSQFADENSRQPTSDSNA